MDDKVFTHRHDRDLGSTVPRVLTPGEHAVALHAAILRAVDRAIAETVADYRRQYPDCPWQTGVTLPDTLAVARVHLEQLLDQVLPYVLHRSLGHTLRARFPTAAELAAVDE